MLGCARPARIAANSSRVASTDLSILLSASLRMSLITAAPDSSRTSLFGVERGPAVAAPRRGSAGADQCSDLLTLHDPQDVALGLHAEDDHRQLVLPAQGERRLVHDAQAPAHRLVVGQVV